VPGIPEALGMACIIGALAVLTVSELLRGRRQTGRAAAAPTVEEDILMQ
jgi:hypothetical protein